MLNIYTCTPGCLSRFPNPWWTSGALWGKRMVRTVPNEGTWYQIDGPPLSVWVLLDCPCWRMRFLFFQVLAVNQAASVWICLCELFSFFFFFLLLLLHAFCLHQVCMRVCVWRWRRAAPHHCGSCCWLATVCVWRPPTRSDRRWISMWLRASPSWATVSVFCVTLSPKVLINHDIRYARRVYCHARWKSTVKLKMKQKRITLWSMKAHLKLYAHAKLRLFCGALTVYTTDWTQMVQQHVGQQYNRTQSLYVLRRTRISAVLMRWED